MNPDRWQGIFHRLAKNQLIAIVRIATELDGQANWQRPGENDAKVWADFLSKLYWPTKDKYIQVYNEVNRASEWGGAVDPEGYAKELEKMTAELKAKSGDFFILNAPLDLALPDGVNSMDAARFYYLMEQTEPGIFAKLDGWASHSYPNPGFAASPNKSGRTGIDGYKWELSQISPYLQGKDLRVFITETGWDRSAVGEEATADNFEAAFANVWTDPKVAAVTPFVFDFPNGLYHDFSFKNYAQFERIKNLTKEKGTPALENTSALGTFSLLGYVLKNNQESAKISFKNTGNYIWNKNNLRVFLKNPQVELTGTVLNKDEIYPGETAFLDVAFKVDAQGPIDFALEVYDGDYLLLSQQKTTVSETFIQRILRILDQMV